MAVVCEVGLPTRLGFGMLAALWFFMGFKAHLRLKRGNIGVSRLRWAPNLLSRSAGSGGGEYWNEVNCRDFQGFTRLIFYLQDYADSTPFPCLGRVTQ